MWVDGEKRLGSGATPNDEEVESVGRGRRLGSWTVPALSVALLGCMLTITILLAGPRCACDANAAAASSRTISPKSPCPPDWYDYGLKCYYYSNSTANWTEARARCAKNGSELARFDTLREYVSR